MRRGAVMRASNRMISPIQAWRSMITSDLLSVCVDGKRETLYTFAASAQQRYRWKSAQYATWRKPCNAGASRTTASSAVIEYHRASHLQYGLILGTPRQIGWWTLCVDVHLFASKWCVVNITVFWDWTGSSQWDQRSWTAIRNTKLLAIHPRIENTVTKIPLWPKLVATCPDNNLSENQPQKQHCHPATYWRQTTTTMYRWRRWNMHPSNEQGSDQPPHIRPYNITRWQCSRICCRTTASVITRAPGARWHHSNGCIARRIPAATQNEYTTHIRDSCWLGCCFYVVCWTETNRRRPQTVQQSRDNLHKTGTKVCEHYETSRVGREHFETSRIGREHFKTSQNGHELFKTSRIGCEHLWNVTKKGIYRHDITESSINGYKDHGNHAKGKAIQRKIRSNVHPRAQSETHILTLSALRFQRALMFLIDVQHGNARWCKNQPTYQKNRRPKHQKQCPFTAALPQHTALLCTLHYHVPLLLPLYSSLFSAEAHWVLKR